MSTRSERPDEAVADPETRGSAAARGRRPRRREGGAGAPRPVPARLTNPFAPATVFSEDRVEAIHAAALGVLEDLGLRVLSPRARALFARAGAAVDDASETVRIGREIVEAAVAAAPRSVSLRGGSPARDLRLEPGALAFVAGGGCPNATDRERGRRPGGLRDFQEITRLTQGSDVLQTVGAAVEPQDVPTHLRHYATARAGLTLSDKPPSLYARGTAQVRDVFAMVRIARGLSEAAFAAEPWCYTVINSNSPRQLDRPMAEGLIDFAEAGQLSVVTPFCLMGAMAPVSLAGAMVLSHAEALAMIALAQLARPGAPVLYGSFTSNVDMKSGAPAFGTPEHVKASIATGQLARRVGLPWRGGAGTSANVNDAQAAQETLMSVWGLMLGGCTLVIHAAGWLEGGLTFGYEKLVTDLDALRTLAELCRPTPAGDDDLALDALAEVAPGGHFFAAAHTMARYETAFFEPIAADRSNWGAFVERGSRDADARATAIWRRMLETAEAPPLDPARIEALDAFAARRSEEGGAPPLS